MPIVQKPSVPSYARRQDYPDTNFDKLNPGDPAGGGKQWLHEFVLNGGGGWFQGDQQQGADPPPQGGQPPAGGNYPGGAQTNTRPKSGGQSSYQPAALPSTSFQGYRAQSYTPAQFNQQLPAGYTAGQVGQFQGPQQQQTSDAVRAAVMQALQNPGFGQQATDQMKAAHKEGATSMQQQLAGQLQQQAASRGTLGGGATAALEQQLGEDTASEILRGYREIDIAAADRANADRLAAVGAGNTFLTGEADRASSLYRTGLEGQLAQEGLRQAESQSGLDRAALARMLANDQAAENRFAAEFGQEEAQRAFDSQFDIEDAALRRALAADDQRRFGAEFGQQQYETDLDAYLQERGQDIDKDLEGRRLDLQGELGRGGLDIDRGRLTESGRQFDQNYLLDLLSFMENQRQFNRRLGFDYTGLGLGANQDFINSILRG